MIVTGALLAESATVVDNKLNIEGGVVAACRVGPQRAVQAMLVVLIQPEPGDQQPKVDIKLTDPTGNAGEFQLDVPKSSLGGEVGFVYFPLQIPVPVDGRYAISVSSDGGFASLPLSVTAE